jgi:hypothetical protein
MATIVTSNGSVLSTSSIAFSSTGSTSLLVNQTSLIYLSSSNRVGINNTAPSYTLDVTGDINSSGNHRSNGITVINNTANIYAASISSSNLTSSGVLFYNSAGTQISNNANNFYWDNTNFRLGIGTSTLNAILHINASNGNTSPILLEKTAGATVFSVTPYSGKVYLGAGIYQNSGGSFVTQNGVSTSYQLIALNPGTGVTWAALQAGISNTSPVTLWNDSGSWISIVNSNNITGSMTGSLLGSAQLTLLSVNGSTVTGSLLSTSASAFILTGSVATGSNIFGNINVLVSTGSAYGLVINASGSQTSYAISASAGSIVATSFSGSLFGSSSYATTSSYASGSGVFAISSSYALSASYAPGGSGLTGGTTNYIPLWTSATTQGSSIISQSGANIIVAGTISASAISSSTYYYTSNLSFVSGSTTSMYLSASGNVGIGTTTPTYKLQVNGSFGATTKSFIINHPTKNGKQLCYGSLESPYHGIRLTGRSRLNNNIIKISLPDYIYKLVRKESVNIQITPIKCNKVIYIDEIDIDNNCFYVKYNGRINKNYEFFWDFTAIRNDVDELQTEI